MDKSQLEIGWIGAMRLLLLGAALLALWYLRDIIVLLLAAVIIAAAVEAPISSLTRRKWPRFAAVLTVYLAGLAILGVLAYIAAPMLAIQIRDLALMLVDVIEELEIPFLVPGIKEFLKGLPENLTAFMPALGGGAGQVFTFLSGAAGLLFGTILVLVVSFYIALQEKWVENSLRTLAPRRYEEYLIGLWKRTERKIGRWFYAQMILSSLVGTLTFVGLSIVGIQHAALIALITAAFSIVPIAGSLFAGIIAFIVAVQQGLDLGIYTIILFVLIQQLEAYVLSPLLHKRALGLNPVMVVFAILIGTRIAGFWGIIIAIPLAAAIAEFWSDIDERRQLNV